MRPLSFIPPLLTATCALAAAPDATALNGDGWAAAFRNGVLVELRNTLSGDVCVTAGNTAPLTGVRLARDKVAATEAAESLQVITVGADGCDAQWSGGLRLKQTMTAEGGELVLRQEAVAQSPPVVGVQWGLAGVARDVEVLVPGHSGLRFGADAPDGLFRFEYPISWEAQFVLLQGKRGGFLIYSDDTAPQFKVFTLEHRSGRRTLAFETRATAPFAKTASVKSVTWRLRPYRGSWLEGARIYREWAERAFDLATARATRPKWAEQIRAVVIVPMEMELLDELAKRLKPEQTLLYVPNWRRNGYDRNYPDYTAHDKFGPWNDRAHALGFRVMPHVNYFGCDPLHPLYEKFKPQQMRDPFTHEPLWWLWERAQPVIKFAYINPASRAWRELFVARMKELCAKHRVDALHLDQTLAIFNDDNGLVDGMNCAQGNLALHRQLRAALPDVAISGEGLDEISYRYEEFAQRHLYGLNHSDGTWNDRLIALAHPVSSSLLTPHTTLYGYLSMANPASGPLYQAWRRGYDSFGVIPTLAHASARQVRESADLLAPFFKEAQFFQRTQALPDFATPWPKNALMVYRVADSGRAVLRRDRGAVLVAQTYLSAPSDSGKSGGADRNVCATGGEIYRRIEGVGEVCVAGSVPGWRAYDDRRIFGLDPAQSYTVLDRPHDLSAFHIAALPPDAIVRRAGARDELATVSLDDAGSEVAQLWTFSGRAESGVQLNNGAERRYPGASFQDESGGNSVMESDGVFLHPPWRNKAAGVSFVEYRLRLPNRSQIRFTTCVGLRPSAAGKSDGVAFRVEARAGHQKLEVQHHAASGAPEPLTLDLSALRGKGIVLRLETHPGPKGNVSFDHALFTQPRVIAESDEPRKVVVHSPKAVRHAIGPNGELRLAPAGKNLRAVSVPLPTTFHLLFDDAIAVALPLDLRVAKHSATLVASDGTESAPHDFMRPAPGAASVGGVKKTALHAHPPQNGRLVVDYLLQLPPTPARLGAFAGIRDGSNSNGVGFSVRVNGRELWSAQMRPGAWKPLQVDLTRHAGQTIVLSLATDALGDFSYDWAAWGEPVIRRSLCP